MTAGTPRGPARGVIIDHGGFATISVRFCFLPQLPLVAYSCVGITMHDYDVGRRGMGFIRVEIMKGELLSGTPSPHPTLIDAGIRAKTICRKR